MLILYSTPIAATTKSADFPATSGSALSSTNGTSSTSTSSATAATGTGTGTGSGTETVKSFGNLNIFHRL